MAPRSYSRQSRGSDIARPNAEEFLRPNIWQHGPAWLQQSEDCWQTWTLTPQIELPEQRGATCLSATPADCSLLQRYSSWPKLIRIIARCLRWKRKRNRATPLTVTELRITHDELVKLLQNIHFSEEIRTLQKDRNAAIKGKLTRLNPFINKEGILRVGGRLSQSSMTFDQKHPIILLLRWPWVSYSCSSWAWSAVIVTGGCRCRRRGTADFSSVFWCVGVKSDSGRRDSNPGSERSQPKTLTTFFFFYLCLLVPGYLHIFFYIIFFPE